MTVPRIILKARRQPLLCRHPWVFAGAIDRVEGTPDDGQEVDVRSTTAISSPAGCSTATARFALGFTPGPRDNRSIASSSAAGSPRRSISRSPRLVYGPDKGCRLVFSEADGLSGCAIDYYAGWLAVQFNSLGLAQRREMFADILEELVQPAGIYI